MFENFDEAVDNDSWKVELEIALLEEADFAKIRSICQNRPVPDHLRKEVWHICLRPETQSASMGQFEEIYDLPNQSKLSADCQKFAKQVVDLLVNEKAKVKNDPSQTTIESGADGTGIANNATSLTVLDLSVPSVTRLASDFEAVLTHFAKTYDQDYFEGNGWLSILSTLYRAFQPNDRVELYACFTSVHHRFIAAGYDSDNRACIVLRLLLQYHEPRLCSLLDSYKISVEQYASAWLCSLFANVVSKDCILPLWDMIFLVSDPLFSLFMSLVFLLNAKHSLFEEEDEEEEEEEEEEKEKVEEMALPELETGQAKEICKSVKPAKSTEKSLSRDEVLALLCDLPRPIEADDLTSLAELAHIFVDKTPTSFRMHYLPLLFGNVAAEAGAHMLAGTLCMPVSVQEVLEAQGIVGADSANMNHSGQGLDDMDMSIRNSGSIPGPGDVRFLLVDCRPAAQYNAGHLATAFYLDSELMLSNPPEFNTTAEALLQSQQRAIAAGLRAAGEHVVFLSSGRPEEDRVANMVVAHFLRRQTQFVGLVEGGYAALHEALGPLGAAASLISHEPAECLACLATTSLQSTASQANTKLRGQSVGNRLSTHPTGGDSGSAFLTVNGNSVSIPTPSAAAAVNAVDNLLSKVSNALFKPRVPTGPASSAQAWQQQQRQQAGSGSVVVAKRGEETASLAAVRGADAVDTSGSGAKKVSATAALPLAMAGAPGNARESSGRAGGSSGGLASAGASISYRNTSAVFSLDDDLDDDDDDNEEENDEAADEARRLDGIGEGKGLSRIDGEMASLSREMASGIGKAAGLNGQMRSLERRRGVDDGVSDYPSRPGGLDTCNIGDLVETSSWSRRREVRGVFPCNYLTGNGQLGDRGYLVLAERHLIVLRHVKAVSSVALLTNGASRMVASLGALFSASGSGKAEGIAAGGRQEQAAGETRPRATVVRRVSLSFIRRITSNRRLPELITFIYGEPVYAPSECERASAGPALEAKDRVFIKDAGNAVKMIKLAVYQCNDDLANSDEEPSRPVPLERVVEASSENSLALNPTPNLQLK